MFGQRLSLCKGPVAGHRRACELGWQEAGMAGGEQAGHAGKQLRRAAPVGPSAGKPVSEEVAKQVSSRTPGWQVPQPREPGGALRPPPVTGEGAEAHGEASKWQKPGSEACAPVPVVPQTGGTFGSSPRRRFLQTGWAWPPGLAVSLPPVRAVDTLPPQPPGR